MDDKTMLELAADELARCQRELAALLAAAPAPAPVATEAVAQGGGVDVEKVMGLVNYYGDCRYSECTANREGEVEAALREAAEGDGVLAQIHALLTAAPAIAKQEGQE